jgi:murein L,D-transpeptidase YcbB/YkuD
MNFKNFCILLLISLCFQDCKNAKTRELSKLSIENIFDIDNYKDHFKKFCRNDYPQGWKYWFPYADTIAYYYATKDYEPVWAFQLADSLFRVKLRGFLKDIRYLGFDPGWYYTEKLVDILNKLDKKQPAKKLYILLSGAEWLLSNAMVTLHHDNALGRTNPHEVFGEFYGLPIDSTFVLDLFSIQNPKTFRQIIAEQIPKKPDFEAMQVLLKLYHEMVDKGVIWTTIDTTGIKKLEPGDTTPIMPSVALKLSELGFMPKDSIRFANPVYYSALMLKYVKRFQASFGLLDDGVLGRNTLILLNISIPGMIDEVRANIERIRWMRLEYEKPFVRVNLPEFRLYMHYPDSVKDMKVCVGKQHDYTYDAQMKRYLRTKKWQDKPKDFETPQISSKIRVFVINPNWTVPNSIIAREMYPHMIKDPYYLQKNNYEVFKDRVRIQDNHKINWRKYKPNGIPYKIVQSLGEDNALGKLKFLFSNPWFIYLHDTPLKSKFNLTERSVTHGCVRIERPLEFGEFVMQNIAKYNYDDFRIMLGYPPQDSLRLKTYLDSAEKMKPVKTMENVYLDKPINIWFDYRTIWADTAGVMQYRYDVYRKNQKLIAKMKQ